MKLFYFFTASVLAKDTGRHRRDTFVERLDEFERLAGVCANNLPARPNKPTVGKNVTVKLERMHSYAKKYCQVQQQVCRDAYGIWEQENQVRISEAEPCGCLSELMIGYKKFFNHAKQGGDSSKGSDHKNERKRVMQISTRLTSKLNDKYQCSL